MKSSIKYRGQRWEKVSNGGWLTKKDVVAAIAFRIMEVWEGSDEDADPDLQQALLYEAGIIYNGEIISITSCKNPSTGCIRLAVYVSLVK